MFRIYGGNQKEPEEFWPPKLPEKESLDSMEESTVYYSVGDN